MRVLVSVDMGCGYSEPVVMVSAVRPAALSRPVVISSSNQVVLSRRVVVQRQVRVMNVQYRRQVQLYRPTNAQYRVVRRNTYYNQRVVLNNRQYRTYQMYSPRMYTPGYVYRPIVYPWTTPYAPMFYNRPRYYSRMPIYQQAFYQPSVVTTVSDAELVVQRSRLLLQNIQNNSIRPGDPQFDDIKELCRAHQGVELDDLMDEDGDGIDDRLQYGLQIIEVTFIQLGDWRIGQVDTNVFAVSHREGKCAVMYRSDGTQVPGPHATTLWNLPYPGRTFPNVIQIGSWRLINTLPLHMRMANVQ